MSVKKAYVALDVGEKRIGVAVGDTAVKIAVPYETVAVDGDELTRIARIIADEEPAGVVVGYPRNQSGEATAQTAYVEAFAEQIKPMISDLYFQDESVTSVLAEERLKASGARYTKEDIDAQAAAIILQDFLEQQA